MTDAVESQIVFVICSCGQKHRLLPGVGAPYYWCGDDVRTLKEGDDIECEEDE